mgnify:CR=1 FL=1
MISQISLRKTVSPVKDSDGASKTLKWILVGMAVFSLVGFLDAAYLTLVHYNRGALSCYIFEGCDKVTTGPYSVIFGIPVSLLGVIYYFSVFITTILYFDTKGNFFLRALSIFPVAGFLASLWFLYLQLFVIKAICFYCVISAVTSTLLFILGILIFKYGGRQQLVQ